MEPGVKAVGKLTGEGHQRTGSHKHGEGAGKRHADAAAIDKEKRQKRGEQDKIHIQLPQKADPGGKGSVGKENKQAKHGSLPPGVAQAIAHRKIAQHSGGQQDQKLGQQSQVGVSIGVHFSFLPMF